MGEPRRADLAVAARLAQDPARPQHSGTHDQSGLEALGQPDVEAAGVAHGGEAPLQHGFEDRLGLDPDARRAAPTHGGEVHGGDGGVDVGVDEAGHERAAPGIEDIDVVVGADRAAALDHLDDPVPLDPHRRTGTQLPGNRVEQCRVGDDERTHAAPS
jgi:hypothetical protein